MLQKILNIKKLFQSNKSKVQIPMNTLYGSKCMFYVANLALICIVITLSIAGVLIYFFVPVVDVSKLSEKVDIREVEGALPVIEPFDVGSSDVEEKKADTYSAITKMNVFSPQRKEWIVKAVNLDPAKLAKKKKKVSGVKPKKIVLHGIVMAGDIKKALISNPLTGVSSKKTLYVEEGEKLEGYMVTSIESDQIRLDWQGEEVIVKLYAGISNNNQTDNTGKVNRGETSKMEYKFKEVEDQHAEVDTDGVNEKADDTFARISDEMPTSIMSMEPEHLYMPVKDDKKLSEEVEIKEVAETLPDIEFVDAGSFGEEQDIVKVEIPGPVDLAVVDELKQEALSEGPIEIVLHGIVIAGNIKKALVKIPTTEVNENRTLFVEEGDGFEGFLVTSIEPDRLRLDWQGEEMIVTFPPLL